jgi:hypothetical protein
MDPILAILLSWQFVFFALAIAAVMYVLRILVEYFMQFAKGNPKNSKLWNDVLLPILPVILGAGSAFFLKLFPYPGFAAGSRGYVITGDRVIFGLVAGLLSTIMYRMIKALLIQKATGIAQSIQGTVQNVIGPPGSTTTTTTITAAPVVAPVVIPSVPDQIPPTEISQRGQV